MGRFSTAFYDWENATRRPHSVSAMEDWRERGPSIGYELHCLMHLWETAERGDPPLCEHGGKCLVVRCRKYTGVRCNNLSSGSRDVKRVLIKMTNDEKRGNTRYDSINSSTLASFR
ncbi:hypothetical protein NPIL_337111 [Nephila pilipes]|uniref:Uncharacterized protein n=1 Tax=Nephila pilipes TaxID=299642 RepID=A0A8X6QJE9_NEPPI|nr:hypothetical protein NPIL_337111 [Nephila pilipes]